jgi:hypothetical protein
MKLKINNKKRKRKGKREKQKKKKKMTLPHIKVLVSGGIYIRSFQTPPPYPVKSLVRASIMTIMSPFGQPGVWAPSSGM